MKFFALSALALLSSLITVCAHADPGGGWDNFPKEAEVHHGMAGGTVGTQVSHVGDATAITPDVGLGGFGLLNDSPLAGKGLILSGRMKLTGEAGTQVHPSSKPLLGVDYAEDLNFGAAGRGLGPHLYLGGGLDVHGHYLKGYDSMFGADMNPLSLGFFTSNGATTFLLKTRSGVGLATDTDATGFYGADAQVYYKDQLGAYAQLIRRLSVMAGDVDKVEGRAGLFARMSPNVALAAEASVVEDVNGVAKPGYTANLGAIFTLGKKADEKKNAQ